jgi:hypothetical protein
LESEGAGLHLNLLPGHQAAGSVEGDRRNPQVLEAHAVHFIQEDQQKNIRPGQAGFIVEDDG